jgi:hypothetical protein
MGPSAAQTVKEIEATRGRLDADFRELEERLPKPAVLVKRLVGIAVGGGIGGTIFWMAVRRARKRKKAAEPQTVPVQAVIQVVPNQLAERVTGAVETGAWKPWLAGAAGLYVILRLAELRQMRRMNRAPVTTR